MAWKRKVACHAYGGEGLQRGLDGGCDSIEHGLDMTDAQIAQMKRQGTWYVPTLAIYYIENADRTPRTENATRLAGVPTRYRSRKPWRLG